MIGAGRLTSGAALMAATALLGGSGCGGDTEPADTAAPRTDAATSGGSTKVAPPPRTDTAAPRTDTAPRRMVTSPEQGSGGAGDEHPARSQALLTGRGGRISPSVVRVPPYISIGVELRSGDGRSYALRFPGRQAALRAGGQVAASSASFPGLRPGRALVGRPLGPGNSVRIEANAEPGP